MITEKAEAKCLTSADLSSAVGFLRREIDEIDSSISKLLNRRFNIASNMAAHKSNHGLPVRDPAREASVIARAVKDLDEPSVAPHVREVFLSIIEQSVKIQENQERRKESSTFKSVCIIGAGLIGGALSRRIRQVDVQIGRTILTAVDLAENLQLCESSGLFDICTADIESAVQRSELILLCAPPDTNLQLLQKIAPLLKSGQVIMDVSSVKQPICKEAERLNLNGAEFVGGHPFFGTENSGFEFLATVSVEDRTFCLIPPATATAETLKRLQMWLEWLGLKVTFFDAKTHDLVVARTSHLIQLFALMAGSVIYNDIVRTGNQNALILSGGGLATLARLMGSPCKMWEEIFLQNSAEMRVLLEEIEQLIQSFKDVQEPEKFSSNLQLQFSQSHQAREAIADAFERTKVVLTPTSSTPGRNQRP